MKAVQITACLCCGIIGAILFCMSAYGAACAMLCVCLGGIGLTISDQKP